MVATTFILSSSGQATAQEFGDFSSILLRLPPDQESGEFSFQTRNDRGINTFQVGDGFGGNIFTIREFAPSAALSIGTGGIGIGLSTLSDVRAANPQAALHIVGGGTDGNVGDDPGTFAAAFPEAKVIIEDRNEDGEGRTLLDLMNFGPASIRFFDRNCGTGFFVSAGDDRFTIGPDSLLGQEPPLLIEQFTGGTSLAITSSGIGVNTSNPEARLHLTSLLDSDQPAFLVESNSIETRTRNMIDVVNNGPMIQQFTDTSTAEPGVFQLQARSDRFSVQQVGNLRAGFAVFEDGAVRFVANAQPNITVTPTGSLNIVGSGPGGGNLTVGLGRDIGPNAGNILALGNITAQGDVNVGGELNVPSDVNIKEGFQEIDAKEILRKVKNLPITRWNYIKDENDTSHVGPMAQDFAAAFQLGKSDKHISTVDSDGISLAAIKGLSLIMDEKDTTISAQADEIAELKSELSEIKTELSERSESISELIENFKELKEKVSELN